MRTTFKLLFLQLKAVFCPSFFLAVNLIFSISVPGKKVTLFSREAGREN